MTDALRYIAAFAGGMAFGAVYFALLAHAARRIARAGAAETLLGYLLRLVLAVATIYLALRFGGGIGGAVAVVLGYHAARVVALRRFGVTGTREG